MKNENDLRVLKTRKAIIESFLELLAKKPYEEISVTEICKGALCSRNTFYLHFPYKEALYESIMDSYVEDICSCITTIDKIPTENIEDYFADVMSGIGQAILSQRNKIRPILVGEHSNLFFDRVTDEIRNTLIKQSEQVFPKSSNNKKYRLICWYSASAMIGFLRGCISDVKMPDEEAKALFGEIHSLVSAVGMSYIHNP